mmetsp:Transcript_1557/g.2953  ORF Transcript_1557/g.2953 Transcript_1557/m.2953 type:complete len:108 (-) Transcript_1557:314-637(-)
MHRLLLTFTAASLRATQHYTAASTQAPGFVKRVSQHAPLRLEASEGLCSRMQCWEDVLHLSLSARRLTTASLPASSIQRHIQCRCPSHAPAIVTRLPAAGRECCFRM